MDRSGAFSISADTVYARLGTATGPVLLDVHEHAEPYDVNGAEFGHHGDNCSFDAFLTLFQIKDAALDRLAVIVRGADTGKPELTAQSPGLLALSQGLSMTIGDDPVQLEHGMIVYDALYAWCRQQVAA
jgi:hypothetical protein